MYVWWNYQKIDYNLTLKPNNLSLPQKKEVQTHKENNTLMKIFSKQHGLNYFGLGYWRGITYAQNYLMHMQYPY